MALVRMKALKSYLGAEGNVRRGETVQVTENRAAVLERRRLAARVGSEPAPAQRAPGPTEFKVSDLSVQDVLSRVREGAISREDALRAERMGRQRVTLINALEEGG